MAKQTLIRSVVILTVCGIICKILGAIYRVPLTNVLGSKGMGMYYLIFPIYSFMLSLSSSSLPSALSKLVSSCLSANDSGGAKRYFKCALNLFFVN